MTRRRPNRVPSAPATQGLSALDRDRAGSMADEGGASAIAVEARSDELLVDGVRHGRRAMASWRGTILLAAGVVGVLAGSSLMAWERLKLRNPGRQEA